MKSYPILHLADPLDPGADLMLLGMIDPADLDAFRGEVAHELAALLGVADQVRCDPVLHGAERVVPLELGVDLGVGEAGHPLQPRGRA